MMTAIWVLVILGCVGVIVWGAETFAEHLGVIAVRWRISVFALSLLLAGAEPEELATAVAATLKGAPAIALGDAIGANIAVCLVALGVGALVAPLPFGQRVMRYASLGVPLGALATGFIWDGQVTRGEGALLVALYLAYVTVIWMWEREPPVLGEVEELEEAEAELEAEAQKGVHRWLGRDLMLVIAGLVAMVGGATVLVEAVRQISHAEEMQTVLGLTLIGFATAFELVVLAWSAARRGASETVVAGVVGSFAYNVTMTLGVAAIAHPLFILDADQLHLPALMMIAALILVIGLAVIQNALGRVAGIILILAYLLYLVIILGNLLPN
jgi:cation:H+ antiporter